MTFRLVVDDSGMNVLLSGWDMVMNGRRLFSASAPQIVDVVLVRRGDIEADVAYRQLGFGTHAGGRRPGRRRVGSMLSTGVVGKQFWAVEAGVADVTLLRFDLRDHDFVQAIVEVADAAGVAVMFASGGPSLGS